MQVYAQTILQLLQQLEKLGYPKDDQVYIYNAYKFAITRVVGRYRPSGKTTIAHMIGTASILASLEATKEVITAGLLHVLYCHGDFGNGRSGISSAKRQQAITVLGTQAEEYIKRYTLLKWSWDEVELLKWCDRIPALDAIDRDVLLIRLANELEDYLELGILYCSNAESRQYGTKLAGEFIVELAYRLGYPALANQFMLVFRSTMESRVLTEFAQPGFGNNDFAIISPAYMLKPLPKIHQITTSISQELQNILLKGKQSMQYFFSLIRQKCKQIV